MAATPKSGGKFIMGMAHGSTTDSISPLTYENGFQTVMGFLWGNCLTEVAANGDLVGDIAESFESEDAQTWRFKIRAGVEFHNGKSVTPEDVVASINLHRGEDSTSAAKGVVAPIQDMAIDGDTVVFTLATPNADFPYLMSDYHLIIMPSENGDVDVTSGIGTGAYKVDGFEPGVRLNTSRNANYYKP
ncbi:MAG: ABC transporter substrate-binding protein, partial [Halocynthiibacter sp.]